MKTNALKSHAHVLCYAKRASKIQVPFHRHLNTFGWYAHRRSDHLAGDLRAGRQSPKQKISGTGAATFASDSLVGLGLVDGASNIDRACNRNLRLPAFRPESDLRSIWVVAVLLFERLLQRSKIHGNLVSFDFSLTPGSFGQSVLPSLSCLKPLQLHASMRARQVIAYAQV